MRQTLGVVRILLTREATDHGLPKQSCQQVLCVPPPAPIRPMITSKIGQAECIVKFTIRQQPDVGSDAAAVEFSPHAAVELDSEGAVICFTRWVFHDRVPHLPTTR